jgi:phosphoserine phosphatase RsbU/P
VNVADLYQNAPCGYISAGADRRITTVNATLSGWLGYEPGALIGMPFTELLTAGGRIHYETHFGPLLQLNGEISGITTDLVTASGTRLPVFLTANFCGSSFKTPAIDGPTNVNCSKRDGRPNSSARVPRCLRELCSAHCFRRRYRLLMA